VVALGPDVSRWKIGDRVSPIFMQGWMDGARTIEHARTALGGGDLDGVLREYGAFHEEGLVRIPDHLSFEEGATLPCAAVTAWNALVEVGNLKAGQTVLVLGTGGVSIVALQLAKLHGARVIVTSSSDAKLELVRAMGAWETVNYAREKAWGKRVRELAGDGVDHVVEVGGAGTLSESLRAVRMGGTVHLIGVLAGGEASVVLAHIFMQQVRVQGVLVGPKSSFEALNRAFEQHEVRPVVDRTFAFEEVPAAFDHMAAGAHFGKICIAIP
jgi:NADPH:quinone reductase-like Zn-dependent oxidoreductase